MSPAYRRPQVESRLGQLVPNTRPRRNRSACTAPTPLDAIQYNATLADNRQAWELQADGNYEQRRPSNPSDERGTHRLLMDLAREGATRST